MDIVVLDGHTLNPGDLDWSPLKEFGTYGVYPRTMPEEICERAAEAKIVLTNKVVLDAATIAQLPKLEYIGVLATGYNVVDLQAAAERDIVVTNIPGYSTASVGQMVFALLLEMTQQVGHHAQLVKQGDWCRSEDFSLRDRPLFELAGKNFGIVGYGQIGQQVAAIANAFGMRVLVHTANPDKYKADKSVEFTDIDSLFDECDVISLNCPLTGETKQLVNTARLMRVKQGTLLINTGRGDLIDEDAVADALQEGYLGGFAADVLATEPPEEHDPLRAAPHTFITPHIAWATAEARQRLLDIALANIQAFQDGTPQNQVN